MPDSFLKHGGYRVHKGKVTVVYGDKYKKIQKRKGYDVFVREHFRRHPKRVKKTKPRKRTKLKR